MYVYIYIYIYTYIYIYISYIYIYIYVYLYVVLSNRAQSSERSAATQAVKAASYSAIEQEAASLL